MARKFATTSIETTLSAAISSTATTLTVASASNLIGNISIGVGDQFAIAIDPDTVNEEVVWVTAVNTGTNILTVVRGQASTSQIAHATGALVKHVLTGEDLTYFNGALPANIVTTKGDLLATGTAGAVNRLPVGTDGQQLVVDSTQTYGIKWATVNPLPSQTGNSGKYLTTDGTNASWGSLAQDTPHPFILMGA